MRQIRCTSLLVVMAVAVSVIVAGCGGGKDGPPASLGSAGEMDTAGVAPSSTGELVVMGYNDLGMHCLNQDFSQIMILPCFNTLHAQIVDRSGPRPKIVTGGVTVNYQIPGNTHSADKTNFWQYVTPLFGMTVAPDMGLTGNGLRGTMKPTGDNDWAAIGIPLTPQTDAGSFNPLQLGLVTVKQSGKVLASARPVVPCSWQINCDLCHVPPPGGTVADSILAAHDRRHSTDLMHAQPVACGTCHTQPPLMPLGIASDDPGNPTLSRAIHHAHARRMWKAHLQTSCYACHPSAQQPCLRDVHRSKGFTCMDCHGDMLAVADPMRRPWQDEPRCGNCHHAHQYEQPGTLYRNSKGHWGIHCEACHGSPHAITPTKTVSDNWQAMDLQGHAGVIDNCKVCHSRMPKKVFRHTLSGT